MSVLTITRPPQFLDPWFVEIEQVWDEIEASVNDNESRIVTLESAIVSDVVTSVSKSGSTQLKGNVTFTGTNQVVLTQLGQNIDIDVDPASIDHGALGGLLDDDHTIYILTSGTRAFTGNQSFGNFQAIAFRVENVAVLPGAGNQGRLVFDQNDLRLKVDNGASFVQVGETDHGNLLGLADDDHLQYLLVSGARAATGNFIFQQNVEVQGILQNQTTEPFDILSREDDGALAVAYILDTSNNLSTAGALLLSLRNNGVEKFAVDKDGNIIVSGVATSSLTSATSLAALIDTDNDSSTETFTIEKDSPSAGGGTLLFEVNETGQAQLPEATAGLRIGSGGVPTSTLDVDGDADLQGDLILSNTGTIQSPSDLIFQVDTDNDEVALWRFRDGAGTDIVTIDELGAITAVSAAFSGDVNILGILSIGDSSRIESTGSMVFQLDTNEDESASYRFENGDGQAVMTLDEDGNLDTTGLITGGSSPFAFLSKAQANGGNPAVATITIIDNALDAGDAIQITDLGPTVHTFTETTDFAIGIDADATAENLKDAINTASIGVSADRVGAVITLTVDQVGTAGNGFVLAEIDNATDNFTLVGFAGGTDDASIAYDLDTVEDHTAIAGSKLLSVKNQGVEVWFVDAEGNTPGGFVTIAFPADGDVGIQAAIDAVQAAGGGIVQLVEGTYSISTTLTMLGYSNITVRGIGDGTILTGNTTFFDLDGAMLVTGVALNAFTEGDTSIFTTTAADAGSVTQGMDILIQGTDAAGDRYTMSARASSAGNGGTGEITLEEPVERSLTTTITMQRWNGNDNIRLENMRLVNTGASGWAILSTGLSRHQYKNLTVEGFEHAVRRSAGFDSLIEDCRFSNITSVGLQHLDSVRDKVSRTKLFNVSSTETVQGDPDTEQLLVENCEILESPGAAVRLDGDRCIVAKNQIISPNGKGIDASLGDRMMIVENYIEDTGSTGVHIGSRSHIRGNRFRNSRGISFNSSTDCIASDNIFSSPIAQSFSGTVSDSVISNNTIIASTSEGIEATFTRCQISGNVIDATARGIRIVDGSDDNIISHNITRNTSTGIQFVGSGSDNNIVSANNCRGQGITVGGGSGNDFVNNKS